MKIDTEKLDLILENEKLSIEDRKYIESIITELEILLKK